VTVIVSDSPSEPPAPVQESEYEVVACSGPTDCEPDVAFEPDQPSEAVHDVELVEDQVSVLVPPLAMLVGLALSVTVGSGAGGGGGGGDALTVTVAVRVTLPPEPVQLSSKLLVVINAPVC
jgi:hypothetical protein